ncbi:MAG: hypothetical protein WDO73_26655 [Ignavibacteriota bacterium]
MSLVLLVQAALLGKSEDSNLHADPGYEPGRVVVAPLSFPDTNGANLQARLDRITSRLRAIPAVRDVTVTDDVPMIGPLTVQVRPPRRPDAIQPVDIYPAGPRFVSTLGMHLVRGRDLERTDPVNNIVISEGARPLVLPARRGRRPNYYLPRGKLSVVGVVRDISPLSVGGGDNPAVWRNSPLQPTRVFLSVRFSTQALASPVTVRNAIREVEPNMVFVSRNLQRWIDLMTEQMWKMVTLIVIPGAVATVLAATGIYGAVSFVVNQRMRDLGIRGSAGRFADSHCARSLHHGWQAGAARPGDRRVDERGLGGKPPREFARLRAPCRL